MHEGKKLFYDRISDFRKKGIPVLISFFKFDLIEFAKSLNTTDERARFVESLTEFIQEYNFDGFSLFCGCSRCLRNHSLSVIYGVENSIDLVRRLSEAFKSRGWLLQAWIDVNETVIDVSGLDVQKLAE